MKSDTSTRSGDVCKLKPSGSGFAAQTHSLTLAALLPRSLADDYWKVISPLNGEHFTVTVMRTLLTRIFPELREASVLVEPL